MNASLRDELLRMDEHDQAVRAELAADGSLFDGYHPRMAAVHDENAERLRAIILEHGWPDEALVGEDGAHAAWRIAQHSINHPAFMRECRQLVDEASANGLVPRWHFAYLDDRVRVYTGMPQRYGTQWRDGPHGAEPFPLDEAATVDELRAELGLPPLAELHAQAPPAKPWSAVDAAREAAKEAAALEWRRSVGWIP
jgi:hypothetical protein